MRSNVLTPIAPHLVADRSLVLEPRATITLELQQGSDNAVLSDVNTCNYAGKEKRVRGPVGRRPRWKKAIVTLKEGEKIDLI